MPSPETAQLIRNDRCTLHQLTAQLLKVYQPVASKQNSFFINDVPDGLKLLNDKEALATLMADAFYIMASCSRDTRINISAEFYSNVVMLHIRDASTFNSYAISSKYQHLRQLAEKIGGLLTITKEQPKETTITISFTNSKAIHPVSNHLMNSRFANGFAYA